MIRVKQSALSAAVKAALLGAMTVGMVACDSEGDVSTSTAVTETANPAPENDRGQVQGTGSIAGVVMDTNNQFVEGAVVTVAGQVTTTDESGRYFFDNVALPGVDGVNRDDASDLDSVKYLVTIKPSAHASATVQVEAQDIQVDSTNNGTGTAGSGFEGAGKQLTWFDGFHADADIAVVPALNAKVKGFLRDCSTNAPMAAGTVVSFDFKNINDDTTVNQDSLLQDAAANAKGNVTVGVAPITAEVQADGSFEAMLPADSDLSIAVSGFAFSGNDVDNGSGLTNNTVDITTTVEGAVQTLGTFEACKVEFEREDIDLTFDDVTGWIDRSVTDAGTQYGMLNRGINKEFSFKFNVPVNAAAFNTADIRVALNNTSYITPESIALGADEQTLTVVLAEALGEGEKLSFFVPYADTMARDYDDEFYNAVVNGGNADATAVDQGEIDFDEIDNSNSQKASYIRVNVCTFQEPQTGGDGDTAQIFDETAGTDADVNTLAEYSSAFQDSRTEDGNHLSQVNGQADTDEKLALLGSLLTSTTITAASDEGRVSVDLIDAGKGTVDAQSDTADFSADVTGRHGTEWTAVFGDGLDIEVARVTKSLVDAIPATTVIQDDYDLHGYNNNTTNTANNEGEGYVATTTVEGFANYGNGGETSNKGVADKPGNPVIWIQPRHLAQKNSDNGNRVARGTEFANLVDSSPVDAYGLRPLYDRDSISSTNYPAQAQQIGVAFSENVTLEGTAPVFGGTETLDGFVVNNDVTLDVDNNVNRIGDNNDTVNNAATSEDLVLFGTDDVIALANGNPLSALNVIDFSGSIVDAVGNVSQTDAEAKVVIADAMPPFVTRAEYDGITEQLVVWFNEPIQPRSEFDDGDLVLVNPVDNTVQSIAFNPNETDSEDLGYFSINSDRNQLTVTISPAAAAAVFVGAEGTNEAFFYDDDVDVNEDAGAEQHAVLRWDGVADSTAERNEWAHFQNDIAGTTTTADRWKVDAPQFLAVDITVPFASDDDVLYSRAAGDVNNVNASQITFTYNLNQPLDALASFGVTLDALSNNGTTTTSDDYYDLTSSLPVSTTIDSDVSTTETTFNGGTATTGLRLIDQNPGAITVSGTAGTFSFRLSADLKTLTAMFELSTPLANAFSGCALLVDATGTNATATSTSGQTLDDGTFRSDSDNCGSPFDSEGTGDQRP